MRHKEKRALLSETGTVVGFGFAKHTTRPRWSIHVVVYKTEKRWVMCVSEIKGAGDRVAERARLGSRVPGSLFAPTAGLGVSLKSGYKELRSALNESLALSVPGIQMEWLADDRLID